ncbi:NAD(P)/FAD-dependent oxidoreductase [Kineosporia rhizophila]|uniref:NAD(P)/FAD-dependent oxidoreductase n=1 Tax=Kineosporia rhizophila TaxID=84633 RepID=UPI001E3F9955|nr:NAD(P)/FAD-dependent oxidoreductase [Kineosporia rhizophila]MCE0539423.1 NAD(P)/FAD-dependent oxidoreductase [Kineosporia rhizophila]
MNDKYDVVVVGGGAAGLSGAVALGRSRRSVLVIDAGEQRNAPAEGIHNYLGREGLNPLELVAVGREEVARYGGTTVKGRVSEVSRRDSGFAVTLDEGREVQARRLLIATGLKDELPAVEGLAEHWGKNVIHCPYCHGYEHRDQAIGVLATTPMAVHQALMFRQLSADVVVFAHTGPEISADGRAQLAAVGVRVVEGEVAAVESVPGGVTGLRLTSGEVVARQVVAVGPRFEARLDGLKGLGLETAPMEVEGFVLGTSLKVDPTGRTEVPGVWAAGNVANPMAQVMVSAGQGLMAGAAINGDLIQEEVRAAMAGTQ